MPTPEEIIQGLQHAANHYSFLAIIWHFLFLTLIAILIAGRRPSRRITGILLSLPLVSVGIVSFLTGNPFNTTVFFIAALVLMFVAYRMDNSSIQIKADIISIFGVLMIGFGWFYPHFLTEASIWQYAYRAPVGLVPCPTLSIVIGFSLLFGGFGSRKWMLVLAFFGLFYGAVGFFRLKVQLDAGLIAGALLLVILAMTMRNASIQQPKANG